MGIIGLRLVGYCMLVNGRGYWSEVSGLLSWVTTHMLGVARLREGVWLVLLTTPLSSCGQFVAFCCFVIMLCTCDLFGVLYIDFSRVIYLVCSI